jgi:hypothetical protein
LLADFYDGSRLRHLVFDYTKDLTINPSQKHVAANNLDLSNKIAGAFNLFPHADRFNEYVVVAIVVQALIGHVKGKCEGTAAHMGESLNTFHILNRHLEAIDQLYSTYSLKCKPLYYSNYPSPLTSHYRPRPSFATGANIKKRDANR